MEGLVLLEEPGKGELDLGRAEQAELSRAILGSKREAETLLHRKCPPSAVVWELWHVTQGGQALHTSLSGSSSWAPGRPSKPSGVLVFIPGLLKIPGPGESVLVPPPSPRAMLPPLPIRWLQGLPARGCAGLFCGSSL